MNTRLHWIPCAFGLLLPFFSPSWAQAQSNSSQTIINGDAEDGFLAVGALVWDNGSTAEDFCTGTLIAPRVVLTAAHCVSDIGNGDLPWLAVFFGNRVNGDGITVGVSAVHAHNRYSSDDRYDIGVVLLEEDAPIDPMQIRTVPLTPEDVGTPVLAVGFGVTSANGNASGRRRSVWLDTYDLDDYFLYNEGQQANTCFGDSGGPTFADEDGAFVQWGITSWGDQWCAEFGANTRVDAFKSWILSRVEEVHNTRDLCEAAGRYGDGTCDSFCPKHDGDCDPPEPEPDPTPSGCKKKNTSAALLLLLWPLGRRRLR